MNPTSMRPLSWCLLTFAFPLAFPLALSLSLSLLTPRESNAAIYLNEAVTSGATKVELFNRSAVPVDLSGWRIRGRYGEFTIPNGTMINGGQYRVIAGLGAIFDPIGGEIAVLDLAGGGPVDRAEYGTEGGAPAPAASFNISLARAPDASTMPAPPLDPNFDAYFWTIDLTSTFGLMNDVPNPNPGSSVCINEMQQNPGVLPDSLELCNPPVPLLGGVIDLSGWFLSTAFGVQPLGGLIPPSSFFGVEVDDALDLPSAYRIDLFDDTGVRVFQKSFWGAPTNQCYGDCPDGAAPPDGYDFFTCGGNVTFFLVGCSIGEQNDGGSGECEFPVVDVPDPDGWHVVTPSWGKVKLIYR